LDARRRKYALRIHEDRELLDMSTAHGEQLRSLEEHADVGRTYNWWGMIFFICSEALIFANLIAAYLYLEIRSPQTGFGHWVLPSGENLDWKFSLGNTVFLLLSSVWAMRSSQALKKGNRTGTIVWLALAILFGLIFLSGQIYEYITLVLSDHFYLSLNTFSSSFFLLTGFHGLHVLIGATFLFIILIRTWRGHFTPQRHFGFEAAEMYWHFVDLVWIFVYSTVYLLPLLLN
jgi:heme/copper-type cytochrome/quinol oxidase subunit 3